MLGFFRKYQRFFFIVTIIGLAVSSVLGLSRFSSEKQTSRLSTVEEHLNQMVQFISYSHFDFLDDRVPRPNWLNDGIVEEFFLKKQLGELLVERIFSSVKEDFSLAIQTANSFTPYRHPNNPLLSAEAVWAQFLPESTSFRAELQRPVGMKSFSLLSHLYLKQKSFPSLFCKRVLLMQEKKEEKTIPDEGIPYADVSLLGLHSLEDFLGPVFLRSVAKVIINSAAYAEKMGLSVSVEEIKEALFANLDGAANLVNKKFATEQLQSIFLQQVHKMGLEEAECLALYKEILLFKKLLTFGSESILLDPLLFEEFYKFAKEKAEIELYSMPEALQLRDFLSLLRLQTYIEAVSSSKTRAHFLSLPKEFLSIAEVQKKTPELVHKDCVLEYVRLDIQKEAALLGLKEVWAWELGNEGWELLKQQFSFLKNQEVKNREERFAILDALEDKERLEVDLFARRKILLCDVNKIRAVLAARPLKKETCSFGSKGEGLPFKDLKDKEGLCVLLEIAAKKTEITSSVPALAAKEKLLFYSEDEQHYYAIQVLERSSESRILSFAEANTLGILRKMVDKRLEEAYPEFRKKTGSLLPLIEVKELVALSITQDLCKSIQGEYRSFYKKEPTVEQSKTPAFYVEHRMLRPLQEALEEEKNGKEPNIRCST